MRRLIIFLIRTRLHLGKYERFQFANQKSNAVYYFTECNVMKHMNGFTEPSSVSLNWLLDPECVVVSVEG